MAVQLVNRLSQTCLL